MTGVKIRKTTHLLAGALIAAIYFKLDSTNALYYWAPILGAYVPDLDALPFLMKWHRVICHNIIFLVMCLTALFLLFMPFVVLQMFFLGFVSHILLDCLTVMGVNISQPFGELIWRGPFHTGDIFDSLLSVAFGTLIIVVISI